MKILILRNFLQFIVKNFWIFIIELFFVHFIHESEHRTKRTGRSLGKRILNEILKLACYLFIIYKNPKFKIGGGIFSLTIVSIAWVKEFIDASPTIFVRARIEGGDTGFGHRTRGIFQKVVTEQISKNSLYRVVFSTFCHFMHYCAIKSSTFTKLGDFSL